MHYFKIFRIIIHKIKNRPFCVSLKKYIPLHFVYRAKVTLSWTIVEHEQGFIYKLSGFYF